MKTAGERIKNLREHSCWSQIELSQKAGINNSVLSRIEAGKRPVEDDLLIKFANIFNVTTDYILGLSSIFKDGKSIPLLGTIRAGLPLLAEENWDEQVEVSANLQADYALRVTGDSMSWK